MTADMPPRIDTTVAHPARRYNYWLGGKDNYQADRDSADAIEAVYPHARTAAVHNRLFLHRVVRYLAEEVGVRQFLDIGTGLPTAENTHEVAQAIDPSARIVYVDNDPLVLAHARALLVSHPAGRTAYLDADLNYPERILTDDELVGTLNMDEPVALLLIAVLHLVPDTDHAYAVVQTLMDALPAGSYLAISHGTGDFVAAATVQAVRAITSDFTSRNRAQVARFFTGLDLIPPGLTPITRWRNPDPDAPPPDQVPVYGGLARKPGPEAQRG
ncbi:SAM-dependent methyltransferase [Nucisporomicrobium flavum]|uniref:SAM-dependent methyltransferase n=1 Tax=Nucisporomicrobium flavum TaxID=2785915 RepID=UPI001F2FB2D6|nr:SAM-dependent methyltransferase [Nucisporomicrobium flavum]